MVLGEALAQVVHISVSYPLGAPVALGVVKLIAHLAQVIDSHLVSEKRSVMNLDLGYEILFHQ